MIHISWSICQSKTTKCGFRKSAVRFGAVKAPGCAAIILRREKEGVMIRVAAFAACLAALGAAPFVSSYIEDHRKADYAAMRAYRIAQMSDDQIRAAKANAKTDREKLYNLAVAELRKSEEESSESRRHCDDVAFKERNPIVCQLPITFGLEIQPNVPSEAELYEQSILGVCDWIDTVKEARRDHCLPP